MNRSLVLVLVAVATLQVCEAGSQWSKAVPSRGSRSYYVSVKGNPRNSGSRHNPWDLASMLEGKHKIAPGSVVWVRGGTYKRPGIGNGQQAHFTVSLTSSSPTKPIHIRAAIGERVTIDGGLLIDRAEYIWMWDFEILVGAAVGKEPRASDGGSSPKGRDHPVGSLLIRKGKSCKFINFNVHDCTSNAIGFWEPMKDSEVHGAVIHTNGWLGPDRGHGHCFYTQNSTGMKTITNCIMSARWGGQLGIQAYGSNRAYVDNFIIEDNIMHYRGRLLVGGGRPSNNVLVQRNYLYGVPLQLGYNAPYNNDAVVRDNVIVDNQLKINRFKKVVNEGNRVLRNGTDKTGVVANLIPNRYDPNRAHLVVFNWSGKKQVPVSVMHRPYTLRGGKVQQMKKQQAWLKEGKSFHLKAHKDLYGKPVFRGRCANSRIEVPAPDEFNVYVVFRGSGAKKRNRL